MAVIKKILNTSVVLVTEGKDEYIVLGKGIGFGAKAGEKINTNNSDYQIFINADEKKKRQAYELTDKVPVEVFDVTLKIVAMAEDELGILLNNAINFALADHINFAIERLNNGIVITNRMMWEMQTFYKKEYDLAKKSVAMINEDLKVNFPDEEIANIAFHFVNASLKNPNYDVAKYTKLIREIVNLTIKEINKEIDLDSIHYSRFITHIKFFVERFFTDKMLEDNDFSLLVAMNVKYRREKEIAYKIKQFLIANYGKSIPEEELTYLVVHIARLARE